MTYFIIYWTLAGFAAFSLPNYTAVPIPILLDFVLSMLFGGIIIPARIMAKTVR